jgi:RNA polymerase sigma-70 factor, ECF subfamily
MKISETELLAALPRLRRYARSLSRDTAEAEDLLQDCVKRALEKQHTWRGENLAGWLVAVMSNLHCNRVRRTTAAMPDTPDADRTAAPDPPADPLERRRLQAAIDLLAADQRTVLMLVVVEGYTYAEVAAILDVPIGTVMSRLSRARASLVETLRGQNILAFSRPA